MVALKMVSPSQEHLEKHYEDLKDKPFFKGLVSCTCIISFVRGGPDNSRYAQWPHRRHGLGRTRCLQDRPSHSWCYQSSRFCSRHHSRRLRHRRWPKRLPRLRQPSRAQRRRLLCGSRKAMSRSTRTLSSTGSMRSHNQNQAQAKL